jgi:hypothetical protein
MEFVIGTGLKILNEILQYRTNISSFTFLTRSDIFCCCL